MMKDQTKNFSRGTMNKDFDERLVPNGQYRDALNFRVGTSDGSDVGAGQNIAGNLNVADIAEISGRDATNARTIGAIEYGARSVIYWFVAGDFFDGIYEFNEISGIATRVLQSNKANAETPSLLNFSKGNIITGVNYIAINEQNGFLFWTDNLNQPRKVNIERAKSYDIDDARIEKDTPVILTPPLYSPHVELFNDVTQSNNMSEKFLYFSYRYKYIDGQFSSMSPFSAVSFGAKNFVYDFGEGFNKAMVNNFNAVRVSFETGDEFVEAIQILVRDTSNINVSIIDTYSKAELFIGNNTSSTIEFKNNKIYSALPDEQVLRLFDNVPLLAKAQTTVGNRLAYGNYVQFRDITDCNNKPIRIDYSLSLRSEAVAVNSPAQTFRSDRDYEVVMFYTDDKGRMTTALTSVYANASQSNTDTIYIPPQNSVTANSILVNIRHNPPCWATNYRFGIKQSKKLYYNIFPILFYADGLFRYFLINQSEIDKFKVGEYIIFKSDGDGPTLINKKYKILELENKSAGFISGNAPTEIAGLYFKIKVNNVSEFNPNSLVIFNDDAQGDSNSPPINQSASSFCEQPIYYGESNPNGLQLLNTTFLGNTDLRITIEIQTSTTFRYTIDVSATGGWIEDVPITTLPTGISVFAQDVCFIVWNIPSVINTGLVPGDRWKINCRKSGNLTGNYFGGVGIPNTISFSAVSGGGSWGGAAVLGDAGQIESGAQIQIEIIQDSQNVSQQAGIQPFQSPSQYENIEEWFVESGAWQQFVQFNDDGINIGATGVTFRRAEVNYVNGGEVYNQFSNTGPVYMIIQGFGYQDNTSPSNPNIIRASLSIQQTSQKLFCESEAIDTDIDIFHETTRTYPIVDGKHKVLWGYDDFQFADGLTRLTQLDYRYPHYFTVGDMVDVSSSNINGSYQVVEIENRYSVIINLTFPGSGPEIPGNISITGTSERDQATFVDAIVQLNIPSSANSDYNGYCFGNGLESNRIKDDFNATTLDYSLRASTTVDKYEQVRADSSVSYSGVFKEKSSINRLNEFNLGISNFKYLDRDFGPIQHLYPRDTNLLIMQENKISKVLYGKNILFDAIGGGQVVSIPEVLGNQIALAGEFGISRNPESFSVYGDDTFFTDTRRGAILQLQGDTIVDISTVYMVEYFREIMTEGLNTQKLGAFDPFLNLYTLSVNDREVDKCFLDISGRIRTLESNTNGDSYYMFTINSNANWEITVSSLGFGTDWIDLPVTSGFGNLDIFALVDSNVSSINRKLLITVTFCGGQIKTFILSQARGKKGSVVVAVFNHETKR
jgi:hypothetical protein